MRRFPLIPGLALAVAVGAGYLALRDGTELTSGALPEVPQVQPQPGGPPVVWVSGRLEEVTESLLTIREGEGASIQLHRLAAGASRFLRVRSGRWQELSEEETEQIRAGERACAEALLDGTTFVALRVFLGASGCGPA
ncbi:MAG TPA: hypothetical protein VE915_05675 [Actinomycetota bacterium]|nr:hypothetical protein [Actinomycetota bacterium]